MTITSIVSVDKNPALVTRTMHPSSEKKISPDKKMKGSKWGETLHLTKRATKEEQAVLIIQTKFRRRAAKKRAAIRKRVQAKNLLAFRDAIRKMNRRYWRQIDLKSLNRVELIDALQALDLPASGKRVQMVQTFTDWLQVPERGAHVAMLAAAQAALTAEQGRGNIYLVTCDSPTFTIQEVMALRNRSIFSLIASPYSEAVLGVTTNEVVHLLKTGGACGRITLCVPDPLELNLEANKSRDNSTSCWVPEPIQFSTLYKQLPRSIALSATIGAMVTVGGDLYTWGDNPHGELGQDHSECGDAHKYPEIVDALGRYEVVSVATGSSHTAAVTSSGEVWIWGSNTLGQLGELPKISLTAAQRDEGIPSRSEQKKHQKQHR